MTLGVMQGRLSPQVGRHIQSFPWDTWQREFPLAARAGVELIEWIVDADRFAENPLLTEHGRARMRQLSDETNTQVRTVCADCFIAWPLTTIDQAERRARVGSLSAIVAAAAEFGISVITLPFVDASAIGSGSDWQAAIAALRQALPGAQAAGVTLALETSLPPGKFRALLDELAPLPVRVNYDSGNSAALGYDVREELGAYGAELAVVHIKDRKRGGGTVPLGMGDTDFGAFFDALRSANYGGPLILQAARADDEVDTVRRYVDFVRQHLGVMERG